MRFDRLTCTASVLLGFTLASGHSLAAQSWKTVAAARQVTDEDQVHVTVTYAAGVLTVGAGAPATLYRSRLTFDEDAATPVSEYADERLRVGISRYDVGPIDLKNWTARGSLDLELSPEVPVDLELELGAVRADLDLTGIPIRSLDLRTEASESSVQIDEPNPTPMDEATFQIGAADFSLRGLGNLNASEVTVRAGVGSVTLELNGAWSGDQALSIDMGLGALLLRIPQDLGVRLERSSFLTSMDTKGMDRRGDAYYSANWDTAEHNVDIEISAALASVDIAWTR